MKPQKAQAEQGAQDFSLVMGGPLYQFFLKTRLARPHLDLLHRRIVLIPALAWLPLLVLTLLEGTALGNVTVPFLKDVEAYARFLVAIPILLVAEVVVHDRLRAIVEQFQERNIVDTVAQPQLEAAISAAIRLRNSLTAEITLLVLVFVAGPLLWTHGFALQADTWYASLIDGDSEFTLAGKWFVFVSAPLFQFLLLRWYFRLWIWWRFMWQVSRIPMQLEPLHPDRAGGIGFLGGSIVAFSPVLVAQSVLLSGAVFTRVLAGVGSAMDFRGEIGVMIVFLAAQILVPLLFFAPDLIAAQRSAMRRFGLLSIDYARGFDRKWLHGDAPAKEALLGSGDIQSLNDLAGSHEIVRGMRPVPFSVAMLVRLLLITSAPFAPLVLTVIAFGDLVQQLAGMLL